MKRNFIILTAVLAMSMLFGCSQNNNTENNQKELPYAKAYIEKINELENTSEPSNPKSYSLVYLDSDDTPELLAANNGSAINLYTYANGKLYTIFEEWTYGAGGNAGYEYAEKENLIRNYTSDFAGLIQYVNYYTVDENFEITPYYDKELKIYMFNDINGDGMPDEGEYEENNLTEHKYFFGEDEVSKEDFDKYLKNGNFKFFEGTKNATELIAELQ